MSKLMHKPVKQGHTFTDLQIYRVVNILDELLTSTSLLKHKSLEMEDQNRGQLFQGDSPADLNLNQERERAREKERER